MKVIHTIQAGPGEPTQEVVFERGLFDPCYKIRLVIDGETVYRDRTPFCRETVARSIRSARDRGQRVTLTA